MLQETNVKTIDKVVISFCRRLQANGMQLAGKYLFPTFPAEKEYRNFHVPDYPENSARSMFAE